MKLWKVLNNDGSACNGGKCQWSLPTHDGPGDWMPWIEEIEPCVSGYHLCRDKDLIHWLGPAIFEAEADGEIITMDDKVVCQSARLLRRLNNWNEKTARLFACDCAWKVLPHYESNFPTDYLPRKAINAAYLYAHQLITVSDMVASRDAACNAAWDAARDAAREAARAASADESWAAVAAWDAARVAARAESWAAAAAWGAARDAERLWQTKRLFSYLYPNGG